MSYNLSDIAEWEWKSFISARESDEKSEYEDSILELIYSIADEKTSLSAIRKAIERVDGKQPENINVQYPKFYMLYPYAKNVNAKNSKDAVVAPIEAPEIKMPAPEMATAGIRGAIAEVSARPKGAAAKVLEIARRFMEDPSYQTRAVIKVKEVIASALIILSKTKQSAMEELLNQIDGKVAVTYKLLGDDVYMTSYDTVAPAGGYLDGDGVYVLESKNITDTWALKLGQGNGS
jgi:hypothetical protein